MNDKSQEEATVIYFLFLENLQAALYRYHTLCSMLSLEKSKHFSIETKEKSKKTAYIHFYRNVFPKKLDRQSLNCNLKASQCGWGESSISGVA